ncbi:MAG: CobD/CbiB family protein [Rhodocyclaceae bacterium]|nr:CobD/CbiB family protein [Rhodocyclaceae bacterium]MBX3669390.1 CobD/CbiB family protein [Rhodocyclaceae bacterium]
MTLLAIFALFLAFGLEQVRPFPYYRLVEGPLAHYSRWMEGRLNAGTREQGKLAWLVAVLPPAALALAVHYLLAWVNPLFALAFDTAVLYVTTGFRSVSHNFTNIQLALQEGDLARARSLVAAWRGRGAERLSSGEIARLAIEEAVLAAYRNVFALVFWFLVLPGPAGVVIYRIAAHLGQRWGDARRDEYGEFGSFARTALDWLDWLPVRCTAAAFAIVGDFEDSVYCWQSQAKHWLPRASGILLASAGGALGVRLGLPVWESGEISDRPELGVGDDADLDCLDRTKAFIWRTLIFWMLLVVLVGIAGWVGR